MRPLKFAVGMLVLLGAVSISASGPVGIYGIIDKVVFEPNEQNAERLQVWGAFAYVDGPGPEETGMIISPAKRGYLYFKMRSAYPGFTSEGQIKASRIEWADLKAVAGTGQAVGFGRWGYIAGFSQLRPDARPVAPSVILEGKPSGGETADLRVRPASEAPANPVTYQTNIGVIKLDANGRHAAIVKALRDAK
jgi:hypothetical protein